MAKTDIIEEEEYPAAVNTAEKEEKKAPARREVINMSDLDDSNTYISLKIGSTVELVTKEIVRVPDEKYCLSNSKDKEGKSYKIEITDQDGQVLSITAWKLWNKIRAAFKALDCMAPVTLKIAHTGHDGYDVSYLKDGKWIKVE